MPLERYMSMTLMMTEMDIQIYRWSLWLQKNQIPIIIASSMIFYICKGKMLEHPCLLAYPRERD